LQPVKSGIDPQSAASPGVALAPRVRPLYRLLYKRLFMLRAFVHRSLSAVKRVRVGEQVRQRNAIARSLEPAGLELDQRTGFRLLQPQDLTGAESAASQCRDIYQAYRSQGRAEEALQRNPNKRFLLSVLSGNEFHAYPDLIRFMISEPIVRMTARYLGTVPVLEGAALWWTPPNDSMTSSQRVHIDELAPRQVKILINCTTTEFANGPLHLVPADISDQLRRQGGHKRGRLDDRWLAGPKQDGQLHLATGQPGSGLVFDSSRCLHFGSRGNTADRLVLAFHFLPLDAPTETRFRLEPCPALGADPDLSALQKLALGYQQPDQPLTSVRSG